MPLSPRFLWQKQKGLQLVQRILFWKSGSKLPYLKGKIMGHMQDHRFLHVASTYSRVSTKLYCFLSHLQPNNHTTSKKIYFFIFFTFSFQPSWLTTGPSLSVIATYACYVLNCPTTQLGQLQVFSNQGKLLVRYNLLQESFLSNFWGYKPSNFKKIFVNNYFLISIFCNKTIWGNRTSTHRGIAHCNLNLHKRKCQSYILNVNNKCQVTFQVQDLQAVSWLKGRRIYFAYRGPQVQKIVET